MESQGLFAKYSLFHRVFLQKRPTISTSKGGRAHVYLRSVTYWCISVVLHSFVALELYSYFWLIWALCVELQSGKDPEDAVSLKVMFRKRALHLVALLRKMTCNVRHPLGLSATLYLLRILLKLYTYFWKMSMELKPPSVDVEDSSVFTCETWV